MEKGGVFRIRKGYKKYGVGLSLHLRGKQWEFHHVKDTEPFIRIQITNNG